MKPLGTLADGFTRYWRKQAHTAFDVLWKSKRLTRTQAYTQLANAMNISTEQCHIGMFDAKQCKRVVKFATDFVSC
jgi:hypothetical protein